MIGHGAILKTHLRANKINVESFANGLSISRQTLYNWFQKMEFEDYLIKKIVDNSTVPKDIFVKKLSESNEADGLVKVLQDQIKSKDETIAALKQAIEFLREAKAPAMASEGTMKKREEKKSIVIKGNESK